MKTQILFRFIYLLLLVLLALDVALIHLKYNNDLIVISHLGLMLVIAFILDKEKEE